MGQATTTGSMTPQALTGSSNVGERAIEAGWLVVLIVAPLFFNPYSLQVFEADKVVLVRSVAVLMLGAWIFVVSGRGRHNVLVGLRRTHGGRVLLLGLLLFGVHVLATLWSVAPRQSFFGSYARLQGLYTTAAYLVLFVSVCLLGRTGERRERLVSVALATSLPVALYGIIQHFGTDPLVWTEDVTHRVASTLGNPIFVSAYLVMVVPLTLHRLHHSGYAAVEGEPKAVHLVLLGGATGTTLLQMAGWYIGPVAGTVSAMVMVAAWYLASMLLRTSIRPFLRLGLYSVLLAAQLMCILLSQSRGPWLGLLAGLFIFGLLLVVHSGRWRRTVMYGATAATATGLLLMLNLFEPPKIVLQNTFVERASRLIDTSQETGRVRVLIWEGAADLVSTSPTRALIGYGPEAMHVVYSPHYPADLGRVERRSALPDRAHNEVYDVVVTTGMIGLSAYLAFMLMLLGAGLNGIGLVRTQPQRRIFLLFLGLLGVAAAIGVRLADDSWRFSGVALAAGVVAGFVIYLFFHAATETQTGDREPRRSAPSGVLVIALISALIAHFVEIQVGIAIAATRTYFWILAGLLVSCVWDEMALADNSDATEVSQSGYHGSHIRRLLVMGILTGLILATVTFPFLMPADRILDPYGMGWLIAFTAIVLALIIYNEIPFEETAWRLEGSRVRVVGAFLLPALLVPACLAALSLYLVRGVGDATYPFLSYTVVLIVSMVAVTIALRGGKPVSRSHTATRVVLGLFLAVCCAGIIWTTNINVARADLYAREGAVALQSVGGLDVAETRFRKAVALQPNREPYLLSLSEVLVRRARSAESHEHRDGLYREAEETLTRALEANPLLVDITANMARFYRNWAGATADDSDRLARVDRARAFFNKALGMHPNSVDLRNELGMLYAEIGDLTSALEAFEHALHVDGSYYVTHQLIGDVHSIRGEWSDASGAYEMAIKQNPGALSALVSLQHVRNRMSQSGEIEPGP